MDKLEDLMIEYENEVEIRDTDFSKISGLKGLCIDNYIFLEKRLTTNDKRCVLAEELGHYKTGVGNILDQNQIANRKQERAAHKWATRELISLDDIILASKGDIHNFYDLAEFLNVTEDFLREGIEILKEIYGTHVEYNGKIIQFEPLDVWDEDDI